MEVLAKTKKKEKPIWAENIVARRKMLGYKGALAFAEAVKVPYPTLRDIEAGTSEGAFETRVKIAAALKWELWQLYAPMSTEATTTIKPPKLAAQGRDALFGAIVASLAALNESELRTAHKALGDLFPSIAAITTTKITGD